jgi:hypothetical protein
MNDDVHTPEHPYCDDPNDWCHTDLDYHAQVTSHLLDTEIDEETLQAVSDIFGIDLTATE